VNAGRFAAVLHELQPLSERFQEAGHRLYLVGGTVRDILFQELGGAGTPDLFDIDATTTARPDEIKRCLQGWADAVWTQGERFGTIGAIKRQPPRELAGDPIERVYEITTHRAEAYHDHSRKPEVEFSFDIQADLSRRDFTVNAMAIELTNAAPDGQPVLVDPFGGEADLAARVLRTPLQPQVSFSDDPLRMLRAARFIARYGLQPDQVLLRAVRSMGERMQIVSAERVRDELDKLLAAPSPSEGLRFVTETGLLRHVVPELAAAQSHGDDPCHPHLWAHTVAVVDHIPPAHRLARWAALLQPLGPDRALARLRALRHANDDQQAVVTAMRLQTRLSTRFMDQAPWTDGEVRRFVRDAGQLRDTVRLLIEADAAVRSGPGSVMLRQQSTLLDHRIAGLEATEPLDDLGPQLDGGQVMALLGLKPGRHVGAAIEFLTDVRLDDGVLDTGDLHDRLAKWWSHHDK
jgi:poly(A) polymerase